MSADIHAGPWDKRGCLSRRGLTYLYTLVPFLQYHPVFAIMPKSSSLPIRWPILTEERPQAFFDFCRAIFV
jgi:hypothetical protein